MAPISGDNASTAKHLLPQSHQAVITLINSFSAEALFTNAYFNWSGTTSIGAYFISLDCIIKVTTQKM
ncbi:ClbS/DfsB family four-helix bundle protein [Lactiplantibacillus pentosus]|uniref:ClbS/DfsB family four-helix bundle protein n=1 Tax=Lactiplantibacillus pentosus TaxID=1589 RepID=UPI0029E1E554|nr:ClbS/DfsB family four-helix bundle protein [Lactiplantibacillus pentosus]